MKRLTFYHGIALFLLTSLGLAGVYPAATAELPPIPPLQKKTSDGFTVPQPGRLMLFPRDHGSHPDYKIEWWYVTGHLFNKEKRRFGFEATFFRQAGSVGHSVSHTDLFRSDQVYLAHMALLDVQSGRFLHQERLNRAGWNAGSSTNGLSLHNGNWSLRMMDSPEQRMKLQGGIHAQASFELDLVPTKPLVVFGENGVSRKAKDPTAASYYLTFTRLRLKGDLQLGETTWPVEGEAWMDHEISSSQLGPDQEGWDWACLQLNDGREIMVYRLRDRDGSTNPFSTLAWVDEKGEVTHQHAGDFSWKPQGQWTSPETKASYPLPVRLECRDPRSGEPRVFLLKPLALAQELTGTVGGVAYWEGACQVTDAQGRELGSAFMELTGYAGNLSTRFR